MTKEMVEDRIYEIQAKVDELGTVAWVATAASITPEKCGQILKDVLYAIKNMSEQISGELDDLCDLLAESTTEESWDSMPNNHTYANTVEFRAEVKKRMTERGLKNKDLAEKTGYSLNSIDCVTSGYRAKISDKLAMAIVEALDMTERLSGERG